MQKSDTTITYILENDILDKDTLKKVLGQQKKTGQTVMSILKENDLVDENNFAKITAAGSKLKFVNLSSDMVDPMVAHMITYEMANQNNIIPIKKSENKILVAMSEPSNIAVRDQIEIRTGCKVIPIVATPTAIAQAVRYHFNVRSVTRQAIASMRLKHGGAKARSDAKDIGIKSAKISDDPVTKLVRSIIAGAIDSGASDIHIEPQEPDMRVRYRVDGLLRDAIAIPGSVQAEVISHIKISSDMDISEKRTPQDGHMAVRHDDAEYDLRVSSLPAVSGEKIVLRILEKTANKWSLDEVVCNQDDNQKFRQLVKNPYGMLLLTGPTGSGKTTTLYSVLKLLNTPEKNIVTVEDPVEYQLDGITQVQVKPIVGRTFATALKSILRQDPDIILIGEIRDLETAEIAISAALTGHLVLSTLHTNDAAGAISRLINIGVPPFLVSSSLLGVVAQRLVRSVCPNCKQPFQPDEQQLKILADADYAGQAPQLYKSGECDSCYKTGYKGRKAVYEILPVSAQIKRMIVDGCSDDKIKTQAIAEGMKTLCKSGIEQVLSGDTTLDELIRVIDVRAL